MPFVTGNPVNSCHFQRCLLSWNIIPRCQQFLFDLMIFNKHFEEMNKLSRATDLCCLQVCITESYVPNLDQGASIAVSVWPSVGEVPI